MKATHTPSGSNTSSPLTAQQMLDYLKAKFEKKDSISTLLDFQLLLQAINDGTLETQLNTFHKLRTKANASGYKLKDWQYTSLLLIALTSSYHYIKDSFLTTANVTVLDHNAIHSHILETQACCSSDLTVNALLTKKPNTNDNNNKKKAKGA